MTHDTNTQLLDDFEEFFRNYYHEEIGELAQKYPNEQKSLHVDWLDLYRYDDAMAEDYLHNPEQMREYAEEALRMYDLPVDVSLGDANVRVYNIDDTRVHDVGYYPSIDTIRGTLAGIRGQVQQRAEKKAKITTAVFECQRCGSTTTIPQLDGMDFQEPHECSGCERQGPFQVNFDQSEFIDTQLIRLQTNPEQVGDDELGTIDVVLQDDLADEVKPGERVIANTQLHLDQDQSGSAKQSTFSLTGTVNNIEKLDSSLEDVDIEAHKEEIQAIADSDDTLEQVVNSIAPSLLGYEDIKRAIAFQLFGGVEKHLPDDEVVRGTIHVFLIGDPGVGKSSLLKHVKSISPRAVYTSGKGTSHAGLTASAVQDDFGDGGWTIKAGALPEAHKGVACIDELDKMEEEDRSGLLEAMSNRHISVAKAGKKTTIPANTTVLSGANPEQGRFNQYEPMGEQLDLHPALLSRFDLIFTMQDTQDVEEDAELAQFMNRRARVGQARAAGNDPSTELAEEVSPAIEPEVLRAYIAYARQHCFPELSDAADERLVEEYVSIRTANDEDGPVPATARKMEALQRLAEASARIRLSDTITVEDAERAIDILWTCLEDIGIDPETGDLDADVIHTGMSQSQRERMDDLRMVIGDLEAEHQDFGAPVEEVVDVMTDLNYEESKVRKSIENLFDKGEVYETRGEPRHMRLTN